MEVERRRRWKLRDDGIIRFATVARAILFGLFGGALDLDEDYALEAFADRPLHDGSIRWSRDQHFFLLFCSTFSLGPFQRPDDALG